MKFIDPLNVMHMNNMGKKNGGSSAPKVKPVNPAGLVPPMAQANGALSGAGTNYGNSNMLGGTSSITRGTFLGN